MKEKSMKTNRRYSAMVVAGVMGITLLGAGAKVYASPVYKVSLDVNPGIEMDVNAFDKVISVEMNEDAEAVLDGVNLENMDIEDAIETAVESISQDGYFDGTGNEVYIGTTSETDEAAADELADELEAAVEEQLAEDGVDAEVTAQGIGYQMVQAAKELSGTLGFEVTPGKYNLLSRMLEAQNAGTEAALQEGTPVITEDIAKMPVKDVMAQIKATRTEAKAESADEAVEEESGTTDEAAVEAQSEVIEQNEVKAQNSEVKVKASGKSELKETNVNSQKGKAKNTNAQED